jgi:hypothetical protein
MPKAYGIAGQHNSEGGSASASRGALLRASTTPYRNRERRRGVGSADGQTSPVVVHGAH